MACDAAKDQSEINARVNSLAITNFNGLEADVICVFQHSRRAATIERHIKFAGEAVHRARVEHIVMPIIGVFSCTQQFLWIDACQR